MKEALNSFEDFKKFIEEKQYSLQENISSWSSDLISSNGVISFSPDYNHLAPNWDKNAQLPNWVKDNLLEILHLCAQSESDGAFRSFFNACFDVYKLQSAQERWREGIYRGEKSLEQAKQTLEELQNYFYATEQWLIQALKEDQKKEKPMLSQKDLEYLLIASICAKAHHLTKLLLDEYQVNPYCQSPFRGFYTLQYAIKFGSYFTFHCLLSTEQVFSIGKGTEYGLPDFIGYAINNFGFARGFREIVDPEQREKMQLSCIEQLILKGFPWFVGDKTNSCSDRTSLAEAVRVYPQAVPLLLSYGAGFLRPEHRFSERECYNLEGYLAKCDGFDVTKFKTAPLVFTYWDEEKKKWHWLYSKEELCELLKNVGEDFAKQESIAKQLFFVSDNELGDPSLRSLFTMFSTQTLVATLKKIDPTGADFFELSKPEYEKTLTLYKQLKKKRVREQEPEPERSEEKTIKKMKDLNF